MRLVTVLSLVVAAGWLIAQQKEQTEAEGTRELFYTAVARKDALPPIAKAAAARNTPAPKSAAALASGVVHFGLRYNVVLVDANTDRSQPVDGDRMFHKGECVAIELQANRSGYLYVLARQTSGEWQPLLPSPEMPNQSNVLNPGEKMRAPKGYCFEITDPPGTETLFVVLSRDPADIYELNEGIKGRTPPAVAPEGKQGVMVMASAQMVNDEVERFSRAIGTSDMVVKKVAKPMAVGEPPHSVYAVNASNKPTTRVVTEIRIQHR